MPSSLRQGFPRLTEFNVDLLPIHTLNCTGFTTSSKE
ncbi:hypothetical protein [Staphylococcus phage vB_SauM-V1SA19]|nr:hypothetical protein [Staphylococcus phage vB_SauM-V1SA19]